MDHHTQVGQIEELDRRVENLRTLGSAPPPIVQDSRILALEQSVQRMQGQLRAIPQQADGRQEQEEGSLERKEQWLGSAAALLGFTTLATTWPRAKAVKDCKDNYDEADLAMPGFACSVASAALGATGTFMGIKHHFLLWKKNNGRCLR